LFASFFRFITTLSEDTTDSSIKLTHFAIEQARSVGTKTVPAELALPMLRTTLFLLV